MRILRIALVSLLAVVVLGGTALVAGLAVQQFDKNSLKVSSPVPAASDDASPATSEADDADAGAAKPVLAPSQAPLEEAFRIEKGDKGKTVRELQSRLYQLAWWPELTTGLYDSATADAVAGFQTKRGMPSTGVVDQATWQRLDKMTKQPTHDQMFNILHPGPTLLGPGASGDDVRDAQARLTQIQWLFGDVSGTYDNATVEAVKGFQAKREIPETGDIDQRTMDRLVAMTSTPTREAMFNLKPKVSSGGSAAGLDPRCLTGRALCIDKTSNSVRWVVDGKVQMSLDARFGSTVNDTPTREGSFSVFRKSRDHVSSLYDSDMPFAMFFSGGQAVHYSSDFATYGYSGASHGCVNIRDYDGIAALYDQVQIGDKAIVYWS